MTHTETAPVSFGKEYPDAEPRTYDELYMQYRVALINRARGYQVRDPEGTVQEVFIKLYRTFFESQDEPGKSIPLRSSWLYKTLFTTAMDEKRSVNRRDEMLGSDMYEYVDYPDIRAESEFDAVELDELNQHLKDALPDDWYAALVRRVFLGDKYREISSDLQTAEGTVKSQIYRSSKLLAAIPEFRELAGKS